jgi:predicted DsbA family dithiol-disulfide isomerase
LKTVRITYFSDVLCVWAYIAQLRVDAVNAAFGDKVAFEPRFCSVFGDTRRKIAAKWGGYDHFTAHLLQSAEAFPEVRLSPDIWRTARPASSLGPHLFLKGAQLAEAAGRWPSGQADAVTRAMREAFFERAEDIGAWDVQRGVARDADADPAAVDDLIRSGEAFAALAADYEAADALRIHGSPSFVLNDGRQKLYGNVGYRIIEANIQELLRAPNPDNASWC